MNIDEKYLNELLGAENNDHGGIKEKPQNSNE